MCKPRRQKVILLSFLAALLTEQSAPPYRRQHPHQYRDTRRELGAGAEDIASSYEVRLLTVGRFVSVETTEERFYGDPQG